jgi:hypothetical protein
LNARIAKSANANQSKSSPHRNLPRRPRGLKSSSQGSTRTRRTQPNILKSPRVRFSGGLRSSPAKWSLRGGVGFPRRYLVRLGEFDDTCG